MNTFNRKLSFWRMISIAFSLVLLSSSCTYTYIPPIPRGRAEPEPSLDLHASSGIQQTAQGLTLLLTAQNVPEADWLAVQWFAPDNTQVASASEWLTPQRDPQEIRFRLPSNIPVSDGDWRAVVSFQNRVARQFSLPIGELETQADDVDVPTLDAPIPEDDIPEGVQPEPREEIGSNDTSEDEPSSSEDFDDDNGSENNSPEADGAEADGAEADGAEADGAEADGAEADAQDEQPTSSDAPDEPPAADDSPASDAP